MDVLQFQETKEPASQSHLYYNKKEQRCILSLSFYQKVVRLTLNHSQSSFCVALG